MGQINNDVRSLHLRIYSDEEDVLKVLLHHFDINYARRAKAAGAVVSAYLLQPDRVLRDSFGFNAEVLLVLHDFDDLQPRAMQAIDQILSEQPYKARANPLVYFLVSKDSKVTDFVFTYLGDHPQSRTPIAISWLEMVAKANDAWFIRNRLSSSLFTRDLFDYQLPLDEDMYFFGRTAIVNDLVDSVRKSQNRGLFGLRKTGKTSLVYKLKRACEENKIATIIYFDCKRPDIRSQTWLGLLSSIADSLVDGLSLQKPFGKDLGIVERFEATIRAIPATHRVCIVFDEVEYISPLATLNPQWKKDFVPFWQTLWSIQSEIRRLSLVIVGVNPYLTELDLIEGIQNPVFGIFKTTMVTGMLEEEVTAMVRRIGRQMGLEFDNGALVYLYNRYGGHPLLTRMACSYTNQRVLDLKRSRPFRVDASILRNAEQDRDSELQFYCRHIVSELEGFYQDEYHMLELLAGGSTAEFIELALEPQWIMHLRGYGIVSIDDRGRPNFKLPVLQRYVAAEAARKCGSRELRTVLPSAKRELWLSGRKSSILRDLRQLIRLVSNKNVFQIYGGRFLPEADIFSSIELARDWQTFEVFINRTFQTFCETIDKIHSTSDFFISFKRDYPDLFYAFNRTRVYRNDVDHLVLNTNTQAAFDEYLEQDLMGRRVTQVQEPWFLLQQIVLDGIFSAIQFEINSYS